jgi:DNA (cytosine-5)-methyltransferase 1
LNYLSVCSGIEAATVAWHHMGWKPVGFSEIEPFPSKVLAHHYPDVTNFGDMTKYKDWNLNDTVELLVGGTPCQSFSVAGLRKGLADPRGNLALVYLGIADHFKPKWIVWENVPGVLSSNGGRDFGSFLGALAELGYGFAYRVLDAQYFGVAQRRRRVFVVGCLGDWRAAAAVLFESESLSGNLAPSREKRKEVAGGSIPSVAGSLDTECGGGKLTHQSVANGHIVGTITARMFNALGHRDVEQGAIMPVVSLALNTCSGANHAHDTKAYVVQPTAYAFDSLSSNSMKSSNPISGCNQVEVSKTLDTSRGLDPSCNQGGIGVAQQVAAFTTKGNGDCFESDIHPTLSVGGGQAGQGYPAARIGMQVRRLTTTECERLQGFPDGYTDIQPNGKPTPDGPRYKALGNSMAVPVMRWIGERIKMVENL